MTNKIDKTDKQFMAAAIRYAKWHIGQTESNPSVGAIIVDKKQKIIGRGVTAISGRPHAETQALQEAGASAKGATAYVTLEPCAHFGQTPPCAKALIDAKIARVVIALKDPDKRVCGQGIAMLKQAGIKVDVGILADKAYEGLSAYMIGKKYNRPEITLKMAVSQDNMVGIKGQSNVKISNKLSHDYSHMLRAENDAIMVGVGTILADNPKLNCRLIGLQSRSPMPIIIDKNCRLADYCSIFEEEKKSEAIYLYKNAKSRGTIVICSDSEEVRLKSTLHTLVSDVKFLGVTETNNILMPQDILQRLYEFGIRSILLEGGTTTANIFLQHKLVDRIALFKSPCILGKNGINAPDFSKELLDFEQIDHAQFENDQYFEWRRKASCLPA